MSTTSTAGIAARESSASGLGAAKPVSALRPPKVAGRLRRYLSLSDFEKGARRKLPGMLYGFIAGGAESDTSLRDNRTSFADWSFVPRVLVDTTARHQTTTLFGQQYAAPFGISPMGTSALFAYRGDLVLAAAAHAANIPMIMSASSLIRLEEVRQAGSPWYQAYLPGETDRIEALVDRVAAAGFDTFVLTVDVPVSANRENNIRNGFSIPLEPTLKLAWEGISHPSWLFGTALRTIMRHGMPHFENMDAFRGPPILARDLIRAVGRRDQLSWRDLATIRRRWRGRLVVKGILSPDDAVQAREEGADGIIVSNHGGRQLDGAIPPLRALPGIVAEKGNMTIMYDGGIRRGTDVLKALALGAEFVFIGRPFLCAAALGGAPFVRRAADVLSEEIDRNMALLGLTHPGQMNAAYLNPR